MKEFFKKKKKEIDRSKFTGYEKAKDEYLEHISKTAKALNTWKLLSFISLGIAIVSVLGMTYLSSRSSLIPYVIEVDETGNAKGINPAYQMNYEPTEANVQFYLREFVNNSRWLSSDIVMQGVFYKKAVALLGREAREKYDNLVEQENWSEMIQNDFTRDVQIESINRVSGTKNSYQIRWIETVYKKGGFIDQKKIVAIFSIEIEPPKDLEEFKYNPLGVRIKDYHITIEGV